MGLFAAQTAVRSHQFFKRSNAAVRIDRAVQDEVAGALELGQAQQLRCLSSRIFACERQ